MRAVLAAALLAAVTAGVAVASSGERMQLRFNPADQTAARAAVARRADLGSGGGWTGGATKPDLSAAPTCPSFHPRQADLVMTGAAASTWRSAAGEIDTQAQVLRTAAMVTADWQRTVVAPAAIPCLRSHLVKQLGAGIRFVGFRRVLFPPVATESRAYVLLVDVRTGTSTVRVARELVVIGHGRTELLIVSTVRNELQKVVAQADAELARALVARAA